MSGISNTEPVFGHRCPGLERFLLAGTQRCVPTIGPDGDVLGCDASNPITLQFCPFCGTAFQCPACGHSIESCPRCPCCSAGECQEHKNWCYA